MACVHLRKLYQLCEENEVKLSGSDLVRIVCHQCGIQEMCPSTLMDKLDEKQTDNVVEEPSNEK